MSRFTMQKHFTALQPMFALGQKLAAGAIETAICNLVMMRVSQING